MKSTLSLLLVLALFTHGAVSQSVDLEDFQKCIVGTCLSDCNGDNTCKNMQANQQSCMTTAPANTTACSNYQNSTYALQHGYYGYYNLEYQYAPSCWSDCSQDLRVENYNTTFYQVRDCALSTQDQGAGAYVACVETVIANCT